MAERGYRWGTFQAWLAIILGITQCALTGLYPITLFVGIALLFLGVGLLQKRLYGLELLYTVAVVSAVGGAWVLFIDRDARQATTAILAVCVWVIPAVTYYPQRRREFLIHGTGEPLHFRSLFRKALERASDTRYRWGLFQAWSSLAFGVCFLGVGSFMSSSRFLTLSVVICFHGSLLVCLWQGLLKKQSFGFVLYYIMLGLSFLAALYLLLKPSPEAIAFFLWWLIPGIFYYPKRRREFGFGGHSA